MKKLFVNATLIATFDRKSRYPPNELSHNLDYGREISDGAILVEDNQISWIGKSSDAPSEVDLRIDLTGCLVIPGLVNTHHHMYQTLTRVIPAAQNCELFGWLATLYPVWQRMTPSMLIAATRTAIAELLLSGCTTSSDHLYIFPNGCSLENSIEAAQQMGIRFHPTRGSMSVGQSRGGLPPDQLIQDEQTILTSCQQIIERWHDPAFGSMLQIGLAPCSPFSVSRELMQLSIELANSHGVRLHSHLAESYNDLAYSREHFGCTPTQYAEELGWLGSNVWFAHCVQLDQTGIDIFAKTHTGVAHCPSSNMRLGSGHAPIRAMYNAGVPIGLGVDGSASNDSGSLLGEARQAMLLARVRDCDPAALSARQSLWLATRGGAQVLGREDIGSLQAGMMADFAAFDLNDIGYAGALHDPLAALVFCSPRRAASCVVNGEILVEDGRLCHQDQALLAIDHNHHAKMLMQ